MSLGSAHSFTEECESGDSVINDVCAQLHFLYSFYVLTLNLSVRLTLSTVNKEARCAYKSDFSNLFANSRILFQRLSNESM